MQSDDSHREGWASDPGTTGHYTSSSISWSESRSRSERRKLGDICSWSSSNNNNNNSKVIPHDNHNSHSGWENRRIRKRRKLEDRRKLIGGRKWQRQAPSLLPGLHQDPHQSPDLTGHSSQQARRSTWESGHNSKSPRRSKENPATRRFYLAQ